MDRDDVLRWVHGYEAAWRSAGTAALAQVFTQDATYLVSPWAQPRAGIDSLGRFWEEGRDGPGEGFSLRTEVVAVDDEAATAVVRVEVLYERGTHWRDLWVLRFAPDGRCAAFEEWPFAPDQPDGH